MTENNETFVCVECKQEKPIQKSGGTGYGVNKDDQKVCYECCGKSDEKEMKEKGKAVLYLTKNQHGKYEVTNWPGTLRFPVTGVKSGRHNFAGTRTDVWFRFNGFYWHGYQIGEMTQICHCKQTKDKA